MPAICRPYKLLSDFEKVGEFLMGNYTIPRQNGYLLQPFWEYAHTHPAFNHSLTHRFGIWEDQGEIVGVACYEMGPGECFLCPREGYGTLLPEILGYAEQHLSKQENDRMVLQVWVTDSQTDIIDLLENRGYGKINEEQITIYPYVKPFPPVRLPNGFSAFSLEEENDPVKIHRCLWEGFNHGPDPDDDWDCRLLMQSGPNFHKDLASVITAPNGDYACFAGMWLEPVNHFAYLEPLATVPRYRRLGLAHFALVAGMEKTKALGATFCYGGSLDFYLNMGFEPFGTRQLYRKVLTGTL